MTSQPSDAETDLPDPIRNRSQKSSRRAAWADYKKNEVDSRPSSLGIAWSGVVLSAACYPIVVGGVQIAIVVFAYGFDFTSVDVFRATFSMMMSTVFGLIYGTLMSIPAYLLSQLLMWSLQGTLPQRAAVGIFGGMTGFLCTTWGGLIIAGAAELISDGELVGLFWLSLLAIVMGHIGASAAGYRKRNTGFPFFEPIFLLQKQITISYLMKLTLVVAVLVLVFKAMGEIGLYVGLTCLAYLVVQTLLLVGEHWIIRWLSRRRDKMRECVKPDY